MMEHQYQLSEEGADEQSKFYQLVWANLGCGLTQLTGFCTAINPIDFTLWTIVVALLSFIAGICVTLVVQLCFFSGPSSRKQKLEIAYARENLKSPIYDYINEDEYKF